MERGAVAGTQRAIGGGLALRQGGDHRMRVADLRCSLIAGLAAAGLITGACGDHGTGTGPGGSSLQLLYGDGATDTVLSVPAQALVVEVRGENGVPVPGTVVRFQSLPIDSAHPFAPGVFVAAVTSTYFETFVADSTDSRGRSLVLIELGTSSGAPKLLVSVPEFGLQDTARFTVLPGNAARVVVQPKDTALYTGKGFRARASVTDRFGNPRSDPVSYSTTTVAITITPSGTVTAGANFARAFYTANARGWTDTGWVSVVPQGTLAALQTGDFGGTAPVWSCSTSTARDTSGSGREAATIMPPPPGRRQGRRWHSG